MSAFAALIRRYQPWSIAIPAALALTALFWAAFIILGGPVASAGSMPSKPMTEITPRNPVPETVFTDSSGTEFTLADFGGEPVLMNLWATWCAPCIKEMPTLLALHNMRDKTGIKVITLSQDHQGAAVADPFMIENGWADLPRYHDPKQRVFRALGARGLPTTYLIDENGEVAALLEGLTDWADEDMIASVQKILERTE